jgi:tetratricopeptide (TPR) repeat protein
VRQGASDSPVAEFCAELRQLRLASGIDMATLARRLSISRTQLYAILGGEIMRPPDWDKVVEPLVAACTGGDRQVLARWRRRHAVLVDVVEELRRRDRRARAALSPAPAPAAGPRQATPAEVRYSLPPDTPGFTGRDAELEQITAAVTAAASGGGVIAIGAIGGMPGIGKTALAVRAAHRLAGRFPDRQLFVSLHGYTPGHDPVAPDDALAGLLSATGLDPRALPGDLAGRAALWRDRMAQQRALLVLDNAASSAQVAPLLPGGPGCLVLVTSRRHLGDLPGAVVPVLLEALPPGQAAEMFLRLAPGAVGSSEDAVAELAELAGYLPLAISLLARVYARHLSWTLADLAAETRESLLTLTAEHDSVAAAFEVSYRHLDPARQRLFRLLGLHPGTTADAWAAAALAGTSVREGAALLDGLHGEGLLTETGHRRYGMHDLLRRYARDHAAAESAGDSGPALERLLDYYTRAAARAEARLARQVRPGLPPAAPAGRSEIPDLDDDSEAVAWARAERASLLACLDHATAAGQDARAIALTAGLTGLLRRDGPWPEAITRQEAAARAAQRLGNRLGQASAMIELGGLRWLAGDYPAAAQALEQALSIFRDIGDRPGQAYALTYLGTVPWLAGDCRAAAQALEQPLSIFGDAGDRIGQAVVLTQLGFVQQRAGDYLAAAQALEQALSIFRDVGGRPDQAYALTHLGAVRRLTGDNPAAVQALEQALSIFCDTGDRLGQALAVSYLGGVRMRTGDYPAAARALEQGVSIFRDLGDRPARAYALAGLGAVRKRTGDYPAAVQAVEQALSIFRDLGDRGGEAEALNVRGALFRVSGELARAEECHRQALELARSVASPRDEAYALAGQGRCALAAGHGVQAGVLLRQALEIFRRIGAAEAPRLAAELDALTGPLPAQRTRALRR